MPARLIRDQADDHQKSEILRQTPPIMAKITSLSLAPRLCATNKIRLVLSLVQVIHRVESSIRRAALVRLGLEKRSSLLRVTVRWDLLVATETPRYLRQAAIQAKVEAVQVPSAKICLRPQQYPPSHINISTEQAKSHGVIMCKFVPRLGVSAERSLHMQATKTRPNLQLCLQVVRPRHHREAKFCEEQGG